MGIVIVAVGRAKAGPILALCDEYRRRIPFSVDIREVEERRPLSGGERKAREGSLLLAAIPDGALIVALDERGKARRQTGTAQASHAIRHGNARRLRLLPEAAAADVRMESETLQRRSHLLAGNH